MRHYFIISILFISLVSINVMAQDDMSRHSVQPLQEVFQTELVYPQEKNEIQFTLAPTFQQFSNYEQILIPFIAEYGITDAWQVEFEWFSFQNRFIYSGSSVRGIGDFHLGTKYSFMNIGNTNFHAAAGFEIGIPLGDETKELSEGFFEYEPNVMMALDFPNLNYAQLFTQVSVGFIGQKEASEQIGDDEPEAHELSLNSGFFIPFKNVVLTSELNWFTNKWNGGDENQLYVTPGLVCNFPGGWETGLGIPLGLNHQSEKYRIIVMITFEFNLSGDDD